MTVGERDDPSGVEGDRGDDLERDMAEFAENRATLERLRQLRCRINQRQLEPNDWALLLAMLEELEGTTETK